MPKFQASSLFSDHAVLCRDREIRIFGTAGDNVCVTACLVDQDGAVLGRDTAPARDGRFLCVLPPQPARTGCAIWLSDGEAEIRFSDIALGDVYLAAGQSNMELELQNADEGLACVACHENDLVRYYNVPKRALPGEEADRANQDARWVAIAPGTAWDMSAVAYFFAMKLQPHTGVPVGIVDCYWGGTSISCWMAEDTLLSLREGQRYLRDYEEKSRGVTLAEYLEKEAAFNRTIDQWNRAVADLKQKHPGITGPEINAQAGPCPWNPPVGPGSPYRPCGLYETMLRRVIPLSLTGVLYYQGEEDTFRTERYDQLLIAFVLMLRQQFQRPDLPFLNVQLPMWIDANAQDSFTWPRLRLAQQKARDQLRHSGLAILLDQGEYDNIHPTNKRVVGERLYLEALRVVYGQSAAQAPEALDKRREGEALAVALSQPVSDRGHGAWLMEIAGEDGAFYPAQVHMEGAALRLTSPSVPRPVSARYAWTDYAVVRLFGENGLPLAPFWLETQNNEKRGITP
ncbi:MAG: hypothetical protein IJ662_07610 [Clostridia bacterium]|nr:hypothetical protein [Clostridia bacterium]